MYEFMSCPNTKWLNLVGTCVSYSSTLRLVEAVSKLHNVPLQKWITEGVTFKFIGDNVDKRGVRDAHSDHSGEMMHMYSSLVPRLSTIRGGKPGILSHVSDVGVDARVDTT